MRKANILRKPLYGSRPEVVVRRENDLGVTFSHELRIVGFLLQLRTELDVVVDLPVEQDRIALRRVGRTPTQRLVGVVEINDGQPVEPEDHISVVPGPGLVGSAMTLAAQRSDHVRLPLCRVLLRRE